MVVQADDLQTGLPQIIVAMITSQVFRAGHPSRVTIFLSSLEGQQSGLLTDSVVMTDNLATIVISAVYRVIGSLPTAEIVADGRPDSLTNANTARIATKMFDP